MHKISGPRECILCGRCLEVCPVFSVTGREDLSPRGKGFLLDRGKDADIPFKSIVELAELCTGCASCSRVCPQSRDLPREIAHLKSSRPDWKSLIWSRIIKAGTGLIPALKSARAVIPRGVPILRQGLWDKPPIAPLLKARPGSWSKKGRAVVFPGCVGRHFRPGLEKNARSLLRLMGYEVLNTPEWQCCGYPLGSAGLFGQERKEILKNIELWNEMDRPHVFVFCATCLDGLTRPVGGLPAGEDDILESFAASVSPLVSGLAQLCFSTTKDPGSGGKILAWHEPCHGPDNEGAVLSAILAEQGYDMIMPEKKCCGMGGSFAIQNPELSSLIARDLWQSIFQNDDLLVLTGCSGCVLQLESSSPDRAESAHWLEVMAAGEDPDSP